MADRTATARQSSALRRGDQRHATGVRPVPPRSARSPKWAKYSTWTVLALFGIALTDGALFLVHVRTASWVDHSRNVRSVAGDARLLAGDRHAAVDAFIATRDVSFLAPDGVARAALAVDLDSLVALTADNPGQQRRAQAVARAYAEWDSVYVVPALSSERAGPPLSRAGAALFAPLSERFAEFDAAEDVLSQERRDRDRALSLITLLATILPLTLLAVIVVRMQRNLKTQTDAIFDQQSQLEEQAIELENQVEELELGNRELVEANEEVERARAAAESALTDRDRTDAFLASSLASSPIGFAFLTLDFRYVRVNATLAANRGLKPEDYHGHSVQAMASTPATGTATIAGLKRVIATGQPVLENEVAGSGGAGEERRYIINYFPIRNAALALIGVGMVVTDNTDRARLEQQFRQSQKMEALGRLASGVAHDFRNLLTVVRSYVDLVMLETPDSDPRRKELMEIRAAADRAALLARQLLAFGKPQPLLAVELDVNDAIRGVQAMLKHIAPAAIAVEMRLAADLGKVLVDPSHVEQVLMNLAINAIDAMPDGGRLTFETADTVLDDLYTKNHQGVVPGDYVMLSVSDTGMGMDAATRERIFEPFFTTKAPGRGTGLGLATVYGIVVQNGGHSWVYSEIGAGTTFKIYFPRLVRTEKKAGTLPAKASGPVRAKAGETVLVVEDDVAVRGSLKRILHKVGYEVLEAEHGVDGLHVARTHDGPIHLAISDLMMPEMSGREFAEQLGMARPDTHVLFMSGFTDEDVLTRGLVDKHHAFIQKPFAIEDITRKVHSVLHQEMI